MTTQLAHITSDNDNHDAWAERGDYWFQKLNPVPQYKARRRHSSHKPLVLSGHGIRLNVDSGTLLIKCGFTHYPQKREEHRFFPQDRQLPSRIVILDGDGSITFDALQWLSAQNVQLVQINWRGEVVKLYGATCVANTAELSAMHVLKVYKGTTNPSDEVIRKLYAAVQFLEALAMSKKALLEETKAMIAENNIPIRTLAAKIGMDSSNLAKILAGKRDAINHLTNMHSYMADLT